MITDELDPIEYRKHLKNTIIKGQKCQRNWDLTKSIPQEDLDLIITAATECPSKQNLDMYSILVIQNRKLQEEIYLNTWTRPGEKTGRFNPQVLANLLLVFCAKEPLKIGRNRETRGFWPSEESSRILEQDRHQAIGVAAGFVNVIAQSLGYSTGCNKCFDTSIMKKILKTDHDPLLMMGVGFKDEERNRREEHVSGEKITSCKKIPIQVTYIN